mmetsp:Transcript_8872/g.24497  ORF Transcript_8872/g.24497 Transcript_8872/m.24497 type:complete len:619 (+) Transcript_8872:53-1909(+)
MDDGDQRSELVRYADVLAASALSFFGIIGAAIAGPATCFVLIAKTYHSDGVEPVDVQLRLSAAMLGSWLVATLFVGRAIEAAGVARCVRAGTALATCACLAYPFAPSLGFLVFIHVLLGTSLAPSGVFAHVMLVSGWFGKARGAALGVLTAFFSLAVGAWPAILYGATPKSWRASMALVSLFNLCCALPLTHYLVRAGRGARGVPQCAEPVPFMRLISSRSLEGREEETGGARPAGSVRGVAQVAEALGRAPYPPEPPACSTHSPLERRSSWGSAAALDGGGASTAPAWGGGLSPNGHISYASLGGVIVVHLALGYIILTLESTLVSWLQEVPSVGLGRAAAYKAAIGAVSIVGKLLCGAGLDSRHAPSVAVSAGALLLAGCSLLLTPRAWLHGGTSGGASGAQPLPWPTALAPAEDLLQLWVFSVVYGLGFGACFAVNAHLPVRVFGGHPAFVRLQSVCAFAYILGGVSGIACTGFLRRLSGGFTAPLLAFCVAATCVFAGITVVELWPGADAGASGHAVVQHADPDVPAPVPQLAAQVSIPAGGGLQTSQHDVPGEAAVELSSARDGLAPEVSSSSARSCAAPTYSRRDCGRGSPPDSGCDGGTGAVPVHDEADGA